MNVADAVAGGAAAAVATASRTHRTALVHARAVADHVKAQTVHARAAVDPVMADPGHARAAA